ncbi:hypothetical protein HanRHA438_Chr17g0817231 [Helianthus annuus]|nr:hypothetical protein HanRHA438_Chr17g0817231 [Helianthus annuus]
MDLISKVRCLRRWGILSKEGISKSSPSGISTCWLRIKPCSCAASKRKWEDLEIASIKINTFDTEGVGKTGETVDMCRRILIITTVKLTRVINGGHDV